MIYVYVVIRKCCKEANVFEMKSFLLAKMTLYLDFIFQVCRFEY